MSQWFSRVRNAFIWTYANEAPRGFVAAIVSLWSVGVFSWLVIHATMQLFGPTPPQIGPGAATAYGALLASGLAGSWGFFMWARGREVNTP